MEWTLQQQGFDYCYDKRLYDRLVGETAAVGTRPPAGGAGLSGAAAALHREPRRAARRRHVHSREGARGRGCDVDAARVRACITRASSTACTPTFRCSSPAGPSSPSTTSSRVLLRQAAAARSPTRDCTTREWQLCDCTAGPTTSSAEQLIAWCWRANGQRRLVVVNLAAERGAGAGAPPVGRPGRTQDGSCETRLSDSAFERDGDSFRTKGCTWAWSPGRAISSASRSDPPALVRPRIGVGR